VKPFAPGRSGAGTVGSIGEEALIRAIRRWLGSASPPPPAGIGDDCAVLPPSPVRLMTVDPLVYGRHFDAAVSPAAAGAKLLKRNLSDIAAMGGRPGAAVVGLVLSPNTSLRWLERFHRGLAAAARKHSVAIVGGDIAQAPDCSAAGTGYFSAHLTLLGSLPGGRALTRRGARIGDRIYVTGVLGGSLASGHHFRFEPRLREGAWLAKRRDVRAMMDVSDGLGKDLRALTPRGAAPAIWAEQLPRRKGATVPQALSDGEDYELVFALAAEADAPGFERAFHRAFPRIRLTEIGRFSPARRVPAGALPPSSLRGYEHLR
jgi:thiamine-monophosphate kinase